ncbi:PGF-CTERM sorting domain-containing protein [Natronorubrum sp. JWXQ-INN-674]|uniref:PGF-CTERM sorting domain-containing protein n=1 Tax=Natronorubrum halalkaliphilum TaxID=2691917 RepID=A0A6B0VPW6_9EURY|nr:PGF-CTERM sorting domain-containing protein [Natronorubrum halalkaliphilum]MXV63056.1 PGF-CTERM sorting domain-containing protein [Natronorubrum halalkaliphilum]
MNRGVTLVVALLVVTSAAGMAMGASAGATTPTESEASTNNQGSEAYAGAHIAFDVESNAIADYQIGGEETFSSVAVQSQSETETEAGLGADVDLETMTTLEAADLSLAAQSRTNAQVEAQSGATLSAHDTERGTLVVESGGEDQYVKAELGAGATASDDGDRVRVETDGHEGTFIVVGDGEVTVNSEGDVTADLEADSTLAFRAYADGERDENAEYEESLIADGNAAVEVHVDQRDGEAVADVATYGQETSAAVSQETQNRVDVTVDRAVHEGTVVVTTVSEEAVGSVEDLEVRVDGEAAAEAASQTELEGAIGGDESRYLVAQQADASAEATLYIAINHFSERTATIDGSDDGDETSGDTDAAGDDADETDAEDSDESDDADGEEGDDAGAGDSVPGFGVGAALVALLGIAAARVHH